MIKILVILGITLATNAFATEKVSKDCFRVQDISNWKAIDNKRLIVWSPTQSHPYLVTLMNRCPSLTFEQTLVFKTTLARTCTNTKDTIFTEDMPCHIKSIQKIDKKRVDILFSAKNALVIDVRSTEEWSEGHLSVAKHLEWKEINSKIEELTKDKNKTIMVYCRSGKRSEKAMKILKDLGYLKVINLGGMLEASKLLTSNIVKQ
tara:strand:+ start:159 stop:773 length:615 start_codon:yes stop_codon:yes gene_type:complete